MSDIQPYRSTLYIPVHQIEEHFKKIRELQVFLALKFCCNGCLELNPLTKTLLLKIIGTTWRTIHDTIKKLVDSNWVGFKPPNIYYPRSFQTIGQLTDCSGNWHVECTINDLRFFQGFAVAAIISIEIKRHKKNLYYIKRRRIEESKNGGSRQSIIRLESNWMSANMLANKLCISKSRAHVLKKEAEKLGYISIKANRQRMDYSLSEVKNFRKYAPTRNWIEIRNFRAYVRGPDRIISNMKVKSIRKNTEPKTKGLYRTK